MIEPISMYNSSSYEPLKLVDCGVLQANAYTNISNTVKFSAIVLFILVVFEWWALNKIMNSGESEERKQELVALTLTFISGIMMLLSFIMIFWLFQ